MIRATTFELNMNDSFKMKFAFWLFKPTSSAVVFQQNSEKHILSSGFLTTLKHYFDIYGCKNMSKCTTPLISLQNGTYTYNYLQV